MGIKTITAPSEEILALRNPDDIHLSVNEIFYSIQGEGLRAGTRCVFVRLQGCSLRCVWCDTPYSLQHKGGTPMSGTKIIEICRHYECNFIEFTGGEPLEQHAVLPLMSLLCDEGYTVAVETGGHIDCRYVDPRIIKIIDMKCPDSKMMSLNNYDNLTILQSHDEIKFVIASREDYEWAKKITADYDLTHKAAAVLFSAVFSTLEFKQLVEWILEDRLDVRFQLQVHKFVWDPNQRGV
jgi:7-carboxy-7-deazaguanine synthase